MESWFSLGTMSFSITIYYYYYYHTVFIEEESNGKYLT